VGQTQIQGQKGEDLAAEYLIERGFKMLNRNVRTPFGEIDLVCRQGGKTVFVEVKLRNSKTFGNPEDSVVGNKLHKLTKSIEWYILNNPSIKEYRLDLIAIEADSRPPKISHLENIE